MIYKIKYVGSVGFDHLSKVSCHFRCFSKYEGDGSAKVERHE